MGYAYKCVRRNTATRRGLATLLTVGLLFSFLLAVVLGLMLFVGPVSLPAAVAAVIVIYVVISLGGGMLALPYIL